MVRSKKKELVVEREIIKEPIRKSIYDVLQANLKLAKRVAFIHRVIYVGEHRMADIADSMETIYKLTNTGYLTEPLSGLLLYYTQYFCCIIEGSEEAIAKHIRYLFQREGGNLGELRFVVAVYHIKSRFCNEWMCYFGRPPERVEDIESMTDFEIAYRYTTECCEKLYRFANAFIQDQLKSHQDTDADDAQARPRSRSIVERDPYSNHLPELKLVKYLVQCQYLATLEHMSSIYEYVGQSNDYKYKTWPTPPNFVPYDVFDEIHNPISDLPKSDGGGQVETKNEEVAEVEDVKHEE